MSELAYIKVFLDWREVTRKLKDAEKGRLIDALVAYAQGNKNVEKQLIGNEAYVFPVLQLRVDHDIIEQSVYDGEVLQNGDLPF